MLGRGSYCEPVSGKLLHSEYRRGLRVILGSL
jgi:hypothetical protein